jgi:hypothetical protein
MLSLPSLPSILISSTPSRQLSPLLSTACSPSGSLSAYSAGFTPPGDSVDVKTVVIAETPLVQGVQLSVAFRELIIVAIPQCSGLESVLKYYATLG